jgi:hypothetical protein
MEIQEDERSYSKIQGDPGEVLKDLRDTQEILRRYMEIQVDTRKSDMRHPG